MSITRAGQSTEQGVGAGGSKQTSTGDHYSNSGITLPFHTNENGISHCIFGLKGYRAMILSFVRSNWKILVPSYIIHRHR